MTLSGVAVSKKPPTRSVVVYSENILDGHKYIQISASINPGNSGGPALNYKGEVVAIITLKATKQEGITFGIPVEDLRPLINKIKKSSDKDLLHIHSYFLANSLFKRLSAYIAVNLLAMEYYIGKMNQAIGLKFDASDGLMYAKEQIDEKRSLVNKKISPVKINKNLKTLYQNEFIDNEAKKGLIELWACAQEVRDYADSPRGNLRTYTNKKNDLFKKYSEISDTLEIRLNIK